MTKNLIAKVLLLLAATVISGCGGDGNNSAPATKVTTTGQVSTSDGTTPATTTPVASPSGTTLSLAPSSVLTDAYNAPVSGTIATKVTFSTSANDLPAAALTPVIPDVAVFLDIDLGTVKNISPPITAKIAVPDTAAGTLVDIYSFNTSTSTWTLEQADVPVASDGTVSVAISHLSIWTASKKPKLVISGNPANKVLAGDAYSFQPKVTASNINNLTFSIVNKPAWASFNDKTGALTGTPGSANVGTTSGIVISVTDGNLHASLPPFNLTVEVKSTGGTGTSGSGI